MTKRTDCILVIVSIRVETVRLVRVKAYKRKRFGKIGKALCPIPSVFHLC